MEKTFATHQICIGSPKCPNPLAWSGPSMVKCWLRECEPTRLCHPGSKHLRAGVEPSCTLFLSYMDLGGANKEGARWKQPGSLRDSKEDKYPEELPNCITFWRGKN